MLNSHSATSSSRLSEPVDYKRSRVHSPACCHPNPPNARGQPKGFHSVDVSHMRCSWCSSWCASAPPGAAGAPCAALLALRAAMGAATARAATRGSTEGRGGARGRVAAMRSTKQYQLASTPSSHTNLPQHEGAREPNAASYVSIVLCYQCVKAPGRRWAHSHDVVRLARGETKRGAPAAARHSRLTWVKAFLGAGQLFYQTGR